jgi:phenylalanyl-tRNA synthetase beta chain
MPAAAREPHRIAALLVGELTPASWRATAPPVEGSGFFELKGVLELLAAGLGGELALVAQRQPFLHPGRCAGLEVGGEPAGWIGELHPLAARAWDLPGATAFELDLAPIAESSRSGGEHYEDVTTFPAVLQDLAVTVDEQVPADRVCAIVREAGGQLLAGARPFDVYHGEQVGEGRKSIALRLEFRAPDRTLTDAEVSELRERIRSRLGSIGGSLRE